MESQSTSTFKFQTNCYAMTSKSKFLKTVVARRRPIEGHQIQDPLWLLHLVLHHDCLPWEKNLPPFFRWNLTYSLTLHCIPQLYYLVWHESKKADTSLQHSCSFAVRKKANHVVGCGLKNLENQNPFENQHRCSEVVIFVVGSCQMAGGRKCHQILDKNKKIYDWSKTQLM